MAEFVRLIRGPSRIRAVVALALPLSDHLAVRADFDMMALPVIATP